MTGEDDFHAGLDIAAERGQPVYATAEGTVDRRRISHRLRQSDRPESRVRHRNPLRASSAFSVSKGQTVKRGDIIGRVGATGKATGPHLHYEVLANGRLSTRSNSSRSRSRATANSLTTCGFLADPVAAWLQSVDIHCVFAPV